MEKIPRGKRASENQKEFLINYLEDNVDIANDKFVTADGAKFREEKWKELAVSLNALGGTHKDGAEWKKYWSDLKLHTRTKYSAIRQAEQISGINGLSRAKALSPLEERIIKITTVQAVDGDETGEVGFEALDMAEASHNLADIVEETFEVVVAECELDGTAAATTLEDATTCPMIGASTSTAAAIRGSTAAARSRGRKRKAQAENPQLEKLFRLEEIKVRQMEIVQIQAVKERTEPIIVGTQKNVL
ncbi:PREDICTED: uncharacterized protein LOC108361022 [Rhagoletis zephyria]|uniref:uncharacterized protein LOC108361022 n=1 Tax=Rhagoletis zephyria TaxID=28612 RepID=UPI0008117427|nr:PREDICTED: uncharacterized protein LOC108361022 [Rhagoletis zephyria]